MEHVSMNMTLLVKFDLIFVFVCSIITKAVRLQYACHVL